MSTNEMDPPPALISSLGESISALAKSVGASQDAATRKFQSRALVQEAKKLILQVQDPVDQILDQVNAVSSVSCYWNLEIVWEGAGCH